MTKTKKATASQMFPEAASLLASIINAALNKYENDPKLENEKGVDIAVDGVGTFTVLRAHGRNQKFIKAYRERVAKLPESEQEDAAREVFADTVIVGLKTAKGEAVPYDDAAKAGVKELLKATPDLYALLMADATNGENFRKVHEAEVKN